MTPGPPDKVFSAGPFQTQDGERLTFGFLLPALQPNGQVAGPIPVSMQSFNVTGGTMTHSYLDDYTARGTPG